MMEAQAWTRFTGIYEVKCSPEADVCESETSLWVLFGMSILLGERKSWEAENSCRCSTKNWRDHQMSLKHTWGEILWWAILGVTWFLVLAFLPERMKKVPAVCGHVLCTVTLEFEGSSHSANLSLSPVRCGQATGTQKDVDRERMFGSSPPWLPITFIVRCVECAHCTCQNW